MPLDPQVETLLDQIAAFGAPPLNEGSVEDARQLARVLATLDGDPEPVSKVEDAIVPGPNGEIPVRIYTSAGGPQQRPVVLWFHAGGGVIGDLETADRSCRKLANRTDALIVSVDYRLAPEHRFPAGIDDCWTVTRWFAENAGAYGGDQRRIAVAGDSMGGTFAAVVAQLAAHSGVLPLRHQLLIYPFTDLTLSHPSIDKYAEGYLVTRALMQWFADQYLGRDGDAKDPLASPLHAPDVSGSAPATVIIPEFDPAYDEALAYVEKLQTAGVPVHALEYEGMIHVFFAFGGVLDRAREVMDFCGTVLRSALA